MMSAAESVSIERLIAERAENEPRKPVFYTRDAGLGGWEAFDWGMLAGQVASAKEVLHSVGVTEGVVVGLLLPTCVTWEVLHIACLGMRATLVGLDHHDLGDNLQHAVGISGVEVLLTDEAADAQLVLPAESSVHTRLIVSLAREREPLSARIVRVARQPGSASIQKVAKHRDGEVLATIIFTSGSTGKPKGIGYTAGQMNAAVEAIVEAFPEIDASKRTVCWLPLSNLFQRIVNLCALQVGAPIYFITDPRQIMQLLPEIRPSVLIAVPRFFEKVFEGIKGRLDGLPAGGGVLLSYLMRRADGTTWYGRLCRVVCRVMTRPVRRSFGGAVEFFISGSAPMPRWLLRNFDAMGLPILEAYGLSESIVPIAANRVRAHRYGSVGLPMSGNELRLGDDGELLCRGPGVCRQQLGGENTLSLGADGFLATGDYAEIDRDGFVWLRGRKSEVFKTSTGRRISPVEIEECLTASGVIDHAVVFGAARKFLVALVTVAVDPESPDAMAQIEYIRTVLSGAVKSLLPYKRPAGVVMRCRSFSPATGELTTNLKLKRRDIEVTYRSAIDTLYGMLDSQQKGTGNMTRYDEITYLGRI